MEENDNGAAVDESRSGRTEDESVPSGARRFPCKNCGGPLLFMPGTTHLKCPYCGTENDIPIDAEDTSFLRENDFLAALEKENEAQANATPGGEAEAVRCTNCGAVTTISAERTSERCPYCGSPLAMQNHFSFKLNVQAVLPFAVDMEKARELYRAWLSSRWFAPNDFARRATREEAIKGIYMPFWTYDASAKTWYTGQRGDAYYVNVPVTVTRNGKTTTEMRSERRIRWSRASGIVHGDFDDVLVPASGSLPAPLQDELTPWRLENLKPFRQEFLSGFVTETYQVGLKDGFDDAKRRMAPAIDQAVRADIGGDEQRVDSQRTEYSKVTFKHILLPVWISAYRYNAETYRFMVNAQTGKLSGERPWSFWKIAGAVVAGLAAIGGIVYYMNQAGMFQ